MIFDYRNTFVVDLRVVVKAMKVNKWIKKQTLHFKPPSFSSGKPCEHMPCVVRFPRTRGIRRWFRRPDFGPFVAFRCW